MRRSRHSLREKVGFQFRAYVTLKLILTQKDSISQSLVDGPASSASVSAGRNAESQAAEPLHVGAGSRLSRQGRRWFIYAKNSLPHLNDKARSLLKIHGEVCFWFITLLCVCCISMKSLLKRIPFHVGHSLFAMSTWLPLLVSLARPTSYTVTSLNF